MSNGFRNMITSKKKLLRPEDMQGLRFRVMESPVYISMFKALGAVPVTIPATEVYLALQNGIVDGYDHPVLPYKTAKNYEVAKLVALTDHAYTPTPLLMNLKVFNGLAKPHQEAILQAAKGAADMELAYITKAAERDTAGLRTLGVDFYDVDRRLFQQRV